MENGVKILHALIPAQLSSLNDGFEDIFVGFGYFLTLQGLDTCQRLICIILIASLTSARYDRTALRPYVSSR